MADIIVAGQATACIDMVAAAIEGLGHRVLHVQSAVDVVGEAIEYGAAMAVLDEHMDMFDGFEVAAMLRDEPEISDPFPILLLVAAPVDVRKLEKSSVTDTFVKDRESIAFENLLIKYLGDDAGVSAADQDPADFLRQ